MTKEDPTIQELVADITRRIYNIELRLISYQDKVRKALTDDL